MLIRQFMLRFGLVVFLLFLSGAQATAYSTDEESSPMYAQAQRVALKEGYGLITTDQLQELLARDTELLLVDVRFPYEFVAGHMPRAVNLPVDLRDRGDLPQERREQMLEVLGPDKDRTIVMYCRDFR